jgi:alkanesulfonate monooxygenase SsuD/methylene tetrahydromethanopterin reductase-like flavin-dependent oxidoreductase (luciferase family)
VEVWIRPSWYYLCQSEDAMPFPVPGSMWDRALGQRLYRDSMRFVRRVDELGFDGVLFTEHHSSPNGGLTPSPVVLLAAATQITERIKLVTMGIQLALYPHPLRVAEELAMVDNLSGGRLAAGFVSTTAASLYAYNLSAAEERSRYHEAYDLVVKAWTEQDPFEWHGEHYDYQCVSILPRPVQVPHPPVWTVAVSAESLQWSAQRRMGLVTSGSVAQAAETLEYYRTYARTECGWTPAPGQLGLAREIFIAPTMAAVREMADRAFEHGGESTFAGMSQAPELEALRREASSMRSYGYRTQPGGRGGTHRSAEAVQSGSFLMGDPDAITEQIAQQQAATGAGVLSIRPELGGLSLDEAADSLELFAREVLPTVRQL